MDYTLSDLARITGAKRRALQLWAEAGVILTEDDVHGGRGTYRRYSRDEATVACVVAYFASMQISIGNLVEVARQFREMLTGSSGKPPIRKPVEQAIAGERIVYLIVHDRTEKFEMKAVGRGFGDTDDEVDRLIGKLVTQLLHEPDSGTIILLLNTHLKALR